ncbi:MAG: hypothetical protein ACK4OM_02385 [Alphaproteobacteria bacterium]
MAKAKIASKNDPSTRGKKQEYFYNSKKVEPVLYIGGNRKFIAAQYSDDGKIVKDKLGNILTWAKISTAAPAA